MRIPTLRMLFVATLVAACATLGCSDDSPDVDAGGNTDGSESTTTAPTTTTSADDVTTSTAGGDVDPELVAAVEAIGDYVESCCGGSEDEATFTLTSGADAALERSVLDPQRPEDARRGVDEPERVDTPSGGTIWIASGDREDQVLSFHCDGANYLLEMGGTSRDDALTAADAVAGALGCEMPEVQAPTECLGLATDPTGCSEDEGAPR